MTDQQPNLIDLVRELRRTVGLFDGAMPISPKQAWEGALAEVAKIRSAWSEFPTDVQVEAAAQAWCEANGHTFHECPWEDLHKINARAALEAARKVEKS